MRELRTRLPMRLTMLHVAAVAGLLAWTAPAMATAVTPQPAAGALQIELSSDKPVYTLGEPVILSVRVVNATGAPVSVKKFSDATDGNVWPQIARGGGDFRRYIGPDFGVKHRVVPETTLAPGESFRADVRVLFHVVTRDPQDLPYFYAFDEPGAYRVRVEVIEMIPGQKLLSDPITVEMRAPGGDDAKVWTMLQRKDAANFLHTGVASGRAAEVSAFEEILDRYPATRYAGGLDKSLQIQRSMRGAGSAAGAGGVAAEVVDVGERAFIAHAPAAVGAKATEDTSKAIADLVAAWTSAWNAGDTARLLQFLSRSNELRRKWDQGEGDVDHDAAASQLESALASLGTLSIQVVSTTIGDQTASADLVVRSALREPRIDTHTMTFVRDGGAWRIQEVGF